VQAISSTSGIALGDLGERGSVRHWGKLHFQDIADSFSPDRISDMRPCPIREQGKFALVFMA
jgi:hypothetical protein